MFTGIVAAIGAIRQVEPLAEGGGVRLEVDAGALGMDDVAIGDSIAIQGACMTVVTQSADGFTVDVSAESLRRTVGLDVPGPVNLEKAMRLSDRVGGHLVSGHVDGQGVVRRFEPVGESHLLEILAPAALAGFLVYKGSVTVDGVSLTINHVEDLPLDAAVDPQWPQASRDVLAAGRDGAGAGRRDAGTAGGASGVAGVDTGAAGRGSAVAGVDAGAAECCAFQINLIPHTVAQTTLKRLRPGVRVNLEIDTVARYLARMRAVQARTGAMPGLA